MSMCQYCGTEITTTIERKIDEYGLHTGVIGALYDDEIDYCPKCESRIDMCAD